jgi:hypothetical protein
MKRLLLILPLLIVGCATTPQETYSKLYSSYEDFKAIAIAPGVTLEQNPYCSMGTGCEFDKTFICDDEKSLDEAKACSMEKCEKFYDIKNDPNWKSEEGLQCLAYDLSSNGYISLNPYFYARLRLDNDINKARVQEYKRAEHFNKSNYQNIKEKAQINARIERRNKQIQAENRATQRAAAAREKAEFLADQKKREEVRIAQAKQAQYENLIKQYQSTCRSYGFNEDNAIATCVQREINLERDRIQGRLNALNAQQNQQIYQDNQRRNQALSNYGRCLSTQGETFSSCSNAWQGYTPPKKTVTKCRYDAFGNTIRGTCTTQ